MFENESDPFDIERIRAYFHDDRFATGACGAVVDEVGDGYAVCSCDIDSRLFNAQGHVMGGALFTLADFALAVASNAGCPDSVSVSSNIDFYTVARGKKLIARAEADRSGRRLGFYSVLISDELGTRVARMQAVCARVASPGAKPGQSAH
ncbi:MAG: PaaI family thioesterase [Coriobacteriales bacterium]